MCEMCEKGMKPVTALRKALRESTCMTPTEGVQWHRIVLDESHYIKNHQAMWSKACLDLTATHKVSHACCVKNGCTL